MRWRNANIEFRSVSESTFPEQRASYHAPIFCEVDYRISVDDVSRVTSFQGARLGPIDLCRYEGVGLHRGDRSPLHIKSDERDDFLVTIPLLGRIDIAQDQSNVTLGPGQFALLSTQKPFAARVYGAARQDRFAAFHCRIGGADLRTRAPFAFDYCGHPLTAEHGAGAVMKSMCETILTEAASLSAAQSNRFGAMLIEAIAAAASEAPEMLASPAHGMSAAHYRIWRQAMDFIEYNLSDIALSTELVAKHCQVSTRYLQDRFSAAGRSATSTIRDLRLERCRTSLRDPAFDQLSIAQIALHWGFNDIPYFSRAYKARFGGPPTADRRSPN